MKTAPHTCSLYAEYCAVLASGDWNVVPRPEAPFLRADKVNVFMRHDIDQFGCIFSLPSLLDLERRHGLISSSYVIVDGSRYDPRYVRAVVDRYAPLGFGFGLHSNCYLYGDGEIRFGRELEIYAGLFGAPPNHFTQHGQGDLGQRERKRFNNSVLARREAGRQSPGTDIGLAYALRFTDSRNHKNGKALSHTPEELAAGLPTLSPGDTALFLTHPFRWTPHTHEMVRINLFNNNLFRG